MVRQWISPMLLLICMAPIGCRKYMPEVDSATTMVIHKTTVSSFSPNECKIALRYHLNSAHGLLDPKFFSFKFYNDLPPFNIICTETDRRIVYEQGASAYSVFVLDDKVNPPDPLDLNLIPYKQYEFKLNIVDFFSKQNECEIGLGCAYGDRYANNVFFPAGEFHDGANMSERELLYLFSAGDANATQDLGGAIESSLRFIESKAHNSLRLLIVITDPTDTISNNALGDLIDNANRINTRICIVNAQDIGGVAEEHNKIALCNGTNGYYSQSGYNDKLFLPAVHSMLTTGRMYESTIEVRSDKSVFTSYSWLDFTVGVTTFDNDSLANNVITYERP